MKLSLCCGCVALLGAWATPSWAEDEKAKSAESEAPSLIATAPFALAAGTTHKLVIRGKHLDDLTSLRLLGGDAPLEIKGFILSPPTGEKPTDKEKEKAKGKPAIEQSLQAEIRVPDNSPLGTNITLVATGPKGESNSLRLYVAAKGMLIDEKDPNGGFKEAQAVETGWSIAGTLSQATDVDVFKIHMKAGQSLRAELFAAQLGSNLDASLNVYHATGALLASNDDTAGRDPALTVKCTDESDCFIAVSSVGEIAAKSTPSYVLKVRVEP